MNDNIVRLQNKPFKKSSVQVALDMIYVATKFKIPAAKVTFRATRVITLKADDALYPNTASDGHVDLTFDARLEGNPTFIYRRLDLSLILTDADTKVDPGHYPYRVADLVPDINLLLGTSFAAEDFVNFQYDGQNDTVLLLAHPACLGWIGQMSVNVQNNRIVPLLSVTELNGFSVYQP